MLPDKTPSDFARISRPSQRRQNFGACIFWRLYGVELKQSIARIDGSFKLALVPVGAFPAVRNDRHRSPEASNDRTGPEEVNVERV